MKPIVTILLFLFSIQTTFSQIVAFDPEIKKMISEVKSENLEATVKKLVSFGTRHTLSDTKSSTRGIGAAQRQAVKIPHFHLKIKTYKPYNFVLS